MKVSLNTIKKHIDFELPPIEELKKRINERLGKVEDAADLGEKYQGIVIVKVMSATKHPNADKLTVCKVDDGGVVQNVPRDEHGYVQVVCGAPNVHEGMFGVWLPPSTTVPASFGTAEPFVLSARELRGVLSQGMLAAVDELGIGTDHNGIVELTNNDLPIVQKNEQTHELKPGLDFAETFELNDTVLELENKMFTHRPDCFGQLGVAREIAGILGHEFRSPKWYLDTPEFKTASGLELTVKNEAPDKVPRFMAVAVKDITIKPSPFWLQAELVRLGSKPINNVVDVTNYVMLLTAQPLHAYDYDKLAGNTLGVRMGHEGEKLPLLNGKTYDVTPEDIVIVDGEKPIGMGGIMGGGNSEVSASTKNIVLECATFDMYAVRKTSMRHGLFTDAVTRFNKGQSPLQNPAALQRAMQYVQQLAGGIQASGVHDETSEVMLPKIEANELVPTLTIKPKFIRDRLGIDMPKHSMVQLLGNVEFPLCEDCGWNPEDAVDNDDDLHVNVPFWRTDIEQPEDIVEEIGRLYGFDKLPRMLPQRSIKPAPKNQTREVARLIRESLSKSGANEVLTYSFVHKNSMERAGQDVSQAFQLGNALSPDLQYYRLSLLPSLLDKIHGNVKAGHDEFTLFEIGKGHNKEELGDDGLPRELKFVDAVYTSKKPYTGAPYFYMRRQVTQLANDLGFTLKFTPADTTMDYPLTAPFDLTRSAMVTSRKGEFIGMIGELKQSVLKNFKLPEYTAAMTLDLQGLVTAHYAAGVNYTSLSRYPSVTQDISLKVKSNVSYEDVFWTAYSALTTAAGEGYDVMVSPLSIYQADGTDSKTITLRVKVTHYDKTLADSDVTPLIDVAAASAAEKLGAERI